MPENDSPNYRMEEDSLGPVRVPADKLWGAQTERALGHFAYGEEQMPIEIVHALGRIKIAAARINSSLGLIPSDVAELVERAASEVAAGQLDEHFPLRIWQSGSGTQTNMNVNEVVANRAALLAGAEPGQKTPVHPNDHVNRCQSTNDAFPSAIHMAAVDVLTCKLLPALENLAAALGDKAESYVGIVKIGRTHLQDAVPLTLGQEFSGYAAQVVDSVMGLHGMMDGLLTIPLGGTAVGTGLNAHPHFAELAVNELRALTGYPFVTSENRFAQLAAHDDLVAASGAVRRTAVALMKIANDIRWLGSGPRCGIGEIRLPANEPGSSIMPGKVNPSQCEALTMACVQVMGMDAAMGMAGSQGNFELNVYKPLMGHCLLSSMKTLAGAVASFTMYCVSGIEADEKRIGDVVDKSLMLVTALAPAIGYDRAAEIAKLALERGATLREICLELKVLDAETFDRLTDPSSMIGPSA
ncbi:class II fumarate hydratase [Desulfovibrio ferrophilus]|uniref:Fumarate hydratase class II n=1 Tax=Desulfovibrio ferrophilus TaxID=241368 RepID=A0A2Z6AUX5_9BACT|nr:class II fumarate hydratase [Desulfovibrio ferrophilus]BBD07039.1 fumarate hydratase [Desulfovibrio ferrophilus]